MIKNQNPSNINITDIHCTSMYNWSAKQKFPNLKTVGGFICIQKGYSMCNIMPPPPKKNSSNIYISNIYTIDLQNRKLSNVKTVRGVMSAGWKRADKV